MPEQKEQEEKPKRVERFIYSEEDIRHIFKLGNTGDIFDTNENVKNSTILLKKMIPNKKKLNK